MFKCTTSEAYSILGEAGEPLVDIKQYPGLSNIPNRNSHRVTGNIYLHGEIERLAGFDIVHWLDGDYNDFVDGIHDIEVVLPGGNYLCKLYLWEYELRTDFDFCKDESGGYIIGEDGKYLKNHYEIRRLNGLVIMDGDEFTDDVMAKYQEKASHI